MCQNTTKCFKAERAPAFGRTFPHSASHMNELLNIVPSTSPQPPPYPHCHVTTHTPALHISATNTTTMTDAQLYEESFAATQVLDQTYDRVHRILGNSHDNATSFTLDVNSELYPIAANESFQMLIASTLNLDGTKDETNQG